MPLPDRLIAGALRYKLAVVAVVVATAGGGVAVALAAGSSPAAAPAPASPSLSVAASPSPSPSASVAAAVVAAAPVAVVPSPVHAAQPAATHAAAPVVKAPPKAGGPAIVPAAAPAPPAPAPVVATCAPAQHLSDTEINWILKEVASTAAAKPAIAGGAATIKTDLTPLLGKNLCADAAQPTVTALCANAGANAAMQAMVGQLPSYEQSMIGQPCSQPLSTTLTKISPYVAYLG